MKPCDLTQKGVKLILILIETVNSLIRLCKYGNTKLI